jgi:hypothetical protein
MTTAEAIDTLVNSYKASAYMEKVTRQIADTREAVSHIRHHSELRRRRHVYSYMLCAAHFLHRRSQSYPGRPNSLSHGFAGRGGGEEGMAGKFPDAVLGAHQEVLREHVQGPGLLLAALRHLHHAVPLRRHRFLRRRPQLRIHPGE